MQPSRATAGPWLSTSSGLNSTSSPWHDRAFRWPVTSTAKARTATPIWVAARPTHAGEARIVSTRSAARARATSSTRSTDKASCLRRGSGSRRTGRTATGALQDVGFGRVQAALDAELAGEVLQSLLELAQVARRRHGDLEDHHVHGTGGVADHPRGQVD